MRLEEAKDNKKLVKLGGGLLCSGEGRREGDVYHEWFLHVHAFQVHETRSSGVGAEGRRWPA